MKKYLVVVAAAVLIVGTADARIGWTLEQCRSHYGREVKTEPAWCGGTASGFIHEGLYIYAIFSADGKVADITYFDNRKARPLPQMVQDSLWRMNAEGRVWENEMFKGWDGKHQVAKLGDENFPHWYIREENGTTVLVGNANHTGLQIRTMPQFWVEQKVISMTVSNR